jgi:hypothetical protein
MVSDEATGKGILVKADGIADTFRAEVKSAITACARRPKLVGILSTSSAPSRSYAMFTKKQCEELGIEFVLRTTGAAVQEGLGEGEDVEDAIIEANEDEGVDGIMARHLTRIFETLRLSHLQYRCTTRFSVCSRFVYNIGFGSTILYARIHRLQDHYLQQVSVKSLALMTLRLNGLESGRQPAERC